MLTITPRTPSPPSWNVRADERFINQCQSARKNAGDDFENNVESKINRICEDPLRGRRKCRTLDGLRGTHIEHLVALWQVSPDITNRDMEDQIDEVYLTGIAHHDDYDQSFINRQPATPHRKFVAILRGENSADIHRVHQTEHIEVTEERWAKANDDDAVIVTGTFEQGHEFALDATLPSGTGLSTATKVAEGVDIGIKRRRVVGQSPIQSLTPGETEAASH